MAPPSCYGALNSTIRKAKATVVNAFGWNESSIDANLLVYAVQQGDMVHFPSGWFHRVDHRGEYLNVGHSFFVPAVLEQRLAAVAPHITSAADAEYYRMWTRRHPWWWYIAPTQVLGMARCLGVPRLNLLIGSTFTRCSATVARRSRTCPAPVSCSAPLCTRCIAYEAVPHALERPAGNEALEFVRSVRGRSHFSCGGRRAYVVL